MRMYFVQNLFGVMLRGIKHKKYYVLLLGGGGGGHLADDLDFNVAIWQGGEVREKMTSKFLNF